MQLRLYLLLLPLIWVACGDAREKHPYESLLRQAPFLEWTEKIDQDPKNDSLYSRRAMQLFENGFNEPALIDLKKAWALHPTPAYATAIVSILEGSPEAQFQFLQDALQKFPNEFSLELSRATLLDKTGSIDSALSFTSKWIGQGRTEVELFLLHASLLDKKGKPAEALRILELLHQQLPQEREITEMLALRYAESGDPGIIPLCDQLQQLDSLGRDATPHYYLGIYYATKRQRNEALNQFDLAIQADHNFIDAYIEKSALLFEWKEYRNALAVLDKALLIAPDQASVYYWTAKCQQALGDRESARLNYLKAYGLDNNFLAAKRAADELK